MVVKIFWEENCALCPAAKEIGEKLKGMGEKVDYCNVHDSNGLNHAIHFDVSTTPSIVLTNEDNEKLAIWQKIMPSFDEIVTTINKVANKC